jgi:hypothetical protein
VDKAAAGVEGLLAGGESEGRTTLSADQGAIGLGHGRDSCGWQFDCQGAKIGAKIGAIIGSGLLKINGSPGGKTYKPGNPANLMSLMQRQAGLKVCLA